MEGFRQDIRFALRTLRKGWGVTAIAIASLALAIGGNTAVFGLINAFLFQPLVMAEPETLVVLQERRSTEPAQLNTLSVSLAAWDDFRQRVRGVDGWAAYRPTLVGLRSDERSEPLTAGRVTRDFFDVIGVQPERGRTFRPDESVEGAPRVAVVSPEFWERQRGGEGDPIGQLLMLDGEAHEVIGVLPETFTFLFSAPDVLLPLTQSPTEAPRDRRDVIAVARLASGTTMERLRSEVVGVAAQMADEYPASREWTTDAFNLRFDIPDGRTKIFYGLLQGSVFFVLLIACANIMNLLLARGQERRTEIALRTVLGAERGRVVRQLLTESAVLVASGAVLGLALGWYGLRLMAAKFADLLPPGYTPEIDGPVLLFTLGVSVMAGLIFGLVPAFQTFNAGQAETLKEGAKSSAGRGRRLLTQGLVVTEIALSLVALGGGGMLVRMFLQLKSIDPGFVGADILTVQVRSPESAYPEGERFRVLASDLLERARGVDGLEHVALVDALPQGVQAQTDTFRVEGQAIDPSAPAPEAYSVAASPEYVDVFRIDVLQGRFFEEGDGADGAPVAVVNRSFVSTWFADGVAVGRTIQVRGATRQIVGVVADVKQVLLATPGAVTNEAVYTPVAQAGRANYQLVARGGGATHEMAEPLRSALQSLDPDLTLTPVLTMQEVVDQFLVGVDIFNSILGGFGVLALLLAAVGTYGVLAYSVNQRRHEIGIRMAVGAQSGAVIRMIARQGITMSLIGLALGGLVMIPLTKLVESLMAGFATVPTGTPALVAALLLVVTTVASFIPAYRASSVSPVQALRGD